MLMCYGIEKKYITANVFLRASVKKKEKQKEQEQRNEIINGSQVEHITSESKYLFSSKFRDLYLR